VCVCVVWRISTTTMANSLEIKLKRADRIYREGDVVSGVVAVSCREPLSHLGISLSMEGVVSLALSPKSTGMFEAFYNSLKPIQLVNYSLEIRKQEKLPAGRTEIPFEFPLKARPGCTLYETYHGVYVNIQYTLRADMKRSTFSKDMTKTTEFLVEYTGKAEEGKQVDFSVSPESLSNVKSSTRIPMFRVEGSLDTAVCPITKPFTGKLTVR
jgi:hypothetical protein